MRHSKDDVKNAAQLPQGKLDYDALNNFLFSAKGALAPSDSEEPKNLPKSRQRRMMSSDTAFVSQTQITKAEGLKRQAYSLYQVKDYFDALLLFQKAVSIFKLRNLTPHLKVT